MKVYKGYERKLSAKLTNCNNEHWVGMVTVKQECE